MPIVVDASIALAWAMPDESSDYADAVLRVVRREGIRVPDLWPREIANGLAVATLRKRIDSSDQDAFLASLGHLKIDVEAASPILSAIGDGVASALRYGLTSYDAAYVDLAAREQLSLATLDKAMVRAAAQFGVSIFEV